MSEASVRGKVHLIEETKTYGQNGFRKRLVVLEQENDRFTNYIPLDFIRDDCDRVDQMKVGDDVEVKYRLSGRKWQKDPSSETRYFLNAEAIDFQVQAKASTGGEKSDESSTANDKFNDASFDENDVPF